MSWAAESGAFSAGGNEATIEHLPAEKLRRYRLPFPPLGEQIRTLKFIEAETLVAGSLLQECESAIRLLQERRSALISAAVTGKIDVRNLVPQPEPTPA